MQNRVKTFLPLLIVMLSCIPATLEILEVIHSGTQPRLDNGDDNDNTGNTSPASGSSIFWALFAITFYASTQPSYSGHWMSGTAFEGFVWPHRSSPIVCLADWILELDEADEEWRRRRREGRSGIVEMRERNGRMEKNAPAAFLLRVGVFVLGVLPQAVKVFSMRGIWRTQAMVAGVFISSIWGLVMSAPYFQRRWIREERPVWSVAAMNRGKDLGKLDESFEPLKFTWLAHLGLVYGAWGEIAERMAIPCPEAVQNMIPKIQLGCTMAGCTVTVLAILRRPAQTYLSIMRPKAGLAVVAIWVCTSTLDLFRPGDKKSSGLPGFALFLAAGLLCFGTACGLKAIARWISADMDEGAVADENAGSGSESTTTTAATPGPNYDIDGDIGMQQLSSDREARPASPPEGGVADAPSNIAQALHEGPEYHSNDLRPGMLLRVSKDMCSVPVRLIFGTLEVWTSGPLMWCVRALALHHVETWMGFALLNVGTAAVYYCWAFDDTGTWAPTWIQILG